MKKETEHTISHPSHRFYSVVTAIKQGKTKTELLDEWERKLYDILKIRDSFKATYKLSYMREFSKSFPLYAALLNAFEDDTPGGARDLLEAVLVATPNCTEAAKFINNNGFDSLFISCYRELFFDITKIIGNPVAEFNFILSPMLRASSDKIAIGNIWKLLALTGGLKLLKRKGVGSEPLAGVDLQQLLQIASIRHCSLILQYAAEGKPFFEDNPIALNVLSTLADMPSIRNAGRSANYMAELTDIVTNNFDNILSSELKLLVAPAEETRALIELDGNFHPENSNAVEKTDHKKYEYIDIEE